jgi:hypothetical protein
MTIMKETWKILYEPLSDDIQKDITSYRFGRSLYSSDGLESSIMIRF